MLSSPQLHPDQHLTHDRIPPPTPSLSIPVSITKPLTCIITVPAKIWRPKPKDRFLPIDYATEYDDTVFIFEKFGRAISKPPAGISTLTRHDIRAWNPILDSDEFHQNFNIGSSVPPTTTQQISHLIHKYWDCFYSDGVKFPVLHFEFTVDTGTSKPVCCPQPRYGIYERVIMQEHLDTLIHNDWIEPATGPWGSMNLAAGNCVVLKPAEFTPISILVMMEVIADLVPPGVINIVNGYGREVGAPLANSKRIAKIGFTGSTATGRAIATAAASNLIPATLELGGKSPNVFFADIMDEDDAFFDKAIEGLVLFAFNQGEVCTCPSRAIIQESIYDKFMDRVMTRVKAIKQGNPLDHSTMLGAQASVDQMNKIMNYIDIGKQEGAEVLCGGNRNILKGDLAEGYYVEPTLLRGHNKMRVFQEEIFGPVLAVTTFKDEADALAIANDTIFGLGAGVWSRNGTTAYRMGRGIKAGRVWTNCYHAYPAHAAFGGYKESGIGRENHKMMLDHYQQTKNLLVSYNPNKLGFF